MANSKTVNGAETNSPDDTRLHDDQQLIQEYLNELDTTYAEVDVSIEEARRCVARAAKTAARLRDLNYGVNGELSETERADLEFDLFEINRGLRDLKRISENHCAWFLAADHDVLAQPTDPGNPQPLSTRTPTLVAEFAAQQSLPADANPSTDVEYQARLGARTLQHLVQRLLLDHGWLPDQSHITWVYPHAFGVGDPGRLRDDRLAEYGPYPPILQLDPDKLIVVPHGQTHGCPRHLRAPRTTALRDPGQLDSINAAITAVEQVAAIADPDKYCRCIEYSDCGRVIDDCEAGRMPWPGDPTIHQIAQLRFVHQRTP